MRKDTTLAKPDLPYPRASLQLSNYYIPFEWSLTIMWTTRSQPVMDGIQQASSPMRQIRSQSGFCIGRTDCTHQTRHSASDVLHRIPAARRVYKPNWRTD